MPLIVLEFVLIFTQVDSSSELFLLGIPDQKNSLELTTLWPMGVFIVLMVHQFYISWIYNCTYFY